MKVANTQLKAGFLSIICLILAIGIADVLNQYSHLRLRSDFFVRWYAIDRLYQDGRNLYDPRNGDEVDQILYGYDNEELRLDFYYPAHLLVFLAPLGLLPYPPAHLIWTIAGQLFLLAGLGIMIWAVGWPPTINQATLYVLAVFLAMPTFHHTYWGQFNTIGILSLALCYAALKRSRYVVAGAVATGLTIKPHPYLLLLAFLFFWVLWRPQRWRFFVGFGGVTAVLWFIAELFQPGWVIDFVQSVGRYVSLPSVVDLIWNPYQLVAASLVIGTLLLFWLNRRAELDSPAFAGCLVLSTAVCALVLPMAFMFHVLALSITQIPLMAAYRQHLPHRYYLLVILFLLIYLGGWLVFLAGFQSGYSLVWTQIAYKIVLPIAQVVAAVPLCFLQPVSHQPSTDHRLPITDY